MRQTCQHCNKQYKNKFTLTRHQKDSCSILRSQTYSDQIVESMKMITDPILRDKIINEIMQQNTNVVSNIVATDQAQVQVQQFSNCPIQIKINMIGQENMSMLRNTKVLEELINILSQFKISDIPLFIERKQEKSIDRSKLHEVILNILKLVSCDRNYSENFNVYVTNKKPEVRFYTYGQNGWEQNGNLDTIKKINKIMLDEFLSVIQNYYMKTETDPQKLMIAKKLMEVINQDENIKFTQNIKQSNSYYFESRKNLLPALKKHSEQMKDVFVKTQNLKPPPKSLQT